jgi:hypothetical protein
VTLNDVSDLLHLPIDGMLLFHESVPMVEVVKMMMELMWATHEGGGQDKR